MSLLDRITERAGELTTRAEQLRKELADVEYELGRLETAGQVVAQLLAEDRQPMTGGPEKAPVARVMIPHPMTRPALTHFGAAEIAGTGGHVADSDSGTVSDVTDCMGGGAP